MFGSWVQSEAAGFFTLYEWWVILGQFGLDMGQRGPTWLEPSEAARNRRKVTVKIRKIA